MNTIAFGNVELAYYDSSPNDLVTNATGGKKATTTLLLVHGFPLSYAMWQSVISCLEQSEVDCRIIAPDLRGYGESSQDESIQGALPMSLSGYADDLAQLLDALGITEPVVYVGFSMGGYIGWPFLENYASRVKALALIDTRAANDTEAGRASRLKMAVKVEEWGAARIAELMRPNLFSVSDTDPRIVEETLRVIRSTSPKTIAASQIAMAERPDSTDQLSGITVPTEVIVGESDLISTVEEMRSIAEAIPDAHLSVIENAGHMTPVERPEEVAKAILKLVGRLKD